MRYIILVSAFQMGCSASPVESPQAVACDGGVGMLDAGAVDAGEPQPQTLWHYHADNGQAPQRSTVAIGFESQFVFTGGFYGGGMMFRLNGDGNALWQFDRDGEFGVAAAETADVFYGANTHEGSFEVYRFHAESGTPDWTYDAAAAGYAADALDTQGKMDTSADGAVMVLAAKAGVGHLALLMFHPGSTTPFAAYTHPDISPARVVSLARDGTIVSFHSGSKVYRYDVTQNEVVGSYDVGAGTDCFVASADGSVVAHGFFSLKVLVWTGAEYELQWTYTYGNSATAQVAGMSADGAKVFAAWSVGALQTVVTRFQVTSNIPRWLYATPIGSGAYQDAANGIAVSDSGDWLALALWGTENNAHEEVMVFEDAGPWEPIWSLDTVGSGMAVDMTPAGTQVVAVGKGVHANVTGNGADVVAVSLP
jgi:hypothetical protein